MGKAATVKRLRQLERRHRAMILANRYLAAGQPERLPELGLPATEIPYLKKMGKYSSADLATMRDMIRYYRTKSRRRLWLPDNGEMA